MADQISSVKIQILQVLVGINSAGDLELGCSARASGVPNLARSVEEIIVVDGNKNKDEILAAIKDVVVERANALGFTTVTTGDVVVWNGPQ